MRFKNILSLIVLGAMWGGSYLFIRLSIDVFHPVLIADLRLLIAALLIGLYLLLDRSTRSYLKIQAGDRLRLLIVGFFNSALPFCLIAYAMQSLTVGLGSILNATAPIWGSLVAYWALRDPLSVWRVLGLLLGVMGVFILVGGISLLDTAPHGWEILAMLTATFSYGASASYIQKYCADLPPLKITFGSMLLGGLLILPLAIYLAPSAHAWPTSYEPYWSVLGLGVISTALAYVLYFRLIEDVGPAKAISSTFLIPVFGMIFGYFLLGEAVDAQMLLGASIVLLGTGLSVGLIKPDQWLKP